MSQSAALQADKMGCSCVPCSIANVAVHVDKPGSHSICECYASVPLILVAILVRRTFARSQRTYPRTKIGNHHEKMAEIFLCKISSVSALETSRTIELNAAVILASRSSFSSAATLSFASSRCALSWFSLA